MVEFDSRGLPRFPYKPSVPARKRFDWRSQCGDREFMRWLVEDRDRFILKLEKRIDELEAKLKEAGIE